MTSPYATSGANVKNRTSVVESAGLVQNSVQCKKFFVYNKRLKIEWYAKISVMGIGC